MTRIPEERADALDLLPKITTMVQNVDALLILSTILYEPFLFCLF